LRCVVGISSPSRLSVITIGLHPPHPAQAASLL